MLKLGRKEENSVNSRKINSSLSENILIPISIFSDKLSSLETICKFLKENYGLSNATIVRLTNRSKETISLTYKNSLKKYSNRLIVSDLKYVIPLSKFAERKLAVLETIASYLKSHYSLNNIEIANLLHRDRRTIWTVLSRAKKKQRGRHEN